MQQAGGCRAADERYLRGSHDGSCLDHGTNFIDYIGNNNVNAIANVTHGLLRFR
jgi:hypothetical protein